MEKLNELMLIEEGQDLTEFLGIQKWEAPINAQLAGVVKGNFPSRIRKTDQERLENLTKEYPKLRVYTWEVTEKLEGSSMTVYYIDGEFGVCSRNLDLKRDENNTFWKVAIAQCFEEKLTAYGKNIAIQGELIGEGVQGNIYGLRGQSFRCFDIQVIDEQRYMTPGERARFCQEFTISHVPVVEFTFSTNWYTIEQLITRADGESLIQKTKREGLVYKAHEAEVSFKTVSRKYLEKQ